MEIAPKHHGLLFTACQYFHNVAYSWYVIPGILSLQEFIGVPIITWYTSSAQVQFSALPQQKCTASREETDIWMSCDSKCKFSPAKNPSLICCSYSCRRPRCILLQRQLLWQSGNGKHFFSFFSLHFLQACGPRRLHLTCWFSKKGTWSYEALRDSKAFPWVELLRHKLGLNACSIQHSLVKQILHRVNQIANAQRMCQGRTKCATLQIGALRSLLDTLCAQMIRHLFHAMCVLATIPQSSYRHQLQVSYSSNKGRLASETQNNSTASRYTNRLLSSVSIRQKTPFTHAVITHIHMTHFYPFLPYTA